MRGHHRETGNAGYAGPAGQKTVERTVRPIERPAERPVVRASLVDDPLEALASSHAVRVWRGKRGGAHRPFAPVLRPARAHRAEARPQARAEARAGTNHLLLHQLVLQHRGVHRGVVLRVVLRHERAEPLDEPFDARASGDGSAARVGRGVLSRAPRAFSVRVREAHDQRHASGCRHDVVRVHDRGDGLLHGPESDQSAGGGGAGRVQQAALDDGAEGFEEIPELALGPTRGQAFDVDVIRDRAHAVGAGPGATGRGVGVGELHFERAAAHVRAVHGGDG
mmetsp:Transcript_14728/g.63211  ORF Transcript_14728/g.63211 Transcript_14728/m.63211 type:complete len:280 (-) Transcript_14728:880-1719(-)